MRGDIADIVGADASDIVEVSQKSWEKEQLARARELNVAVPDVLASFGHASDLLDRWSDPRRRYRKSNRLVPLPKQVTSGYRLGDTVKAASLRKFCGGELWHRRAYPDSLAVCTCWLIFIIKIRT